MQQKEKKSKHGIGELKMKIRDKIKNAIGIMIARYIIHTGADGWLVTRKNGTQQVIKVYSKQAYENMVRPAVEK